MQNGIVILRDSLAVSDKTRYTFTIWSAVVLLAVYSEEVKT